MLRFEDILETVERYLPKPDEDLLRKAYVFSAHAHRNQLRSSGEPYLIHPLNVAMILASMKLDETSIATGLLHDVLEDTHSSRDELAALFGPEVAHLVDGVTKIGRYAFTSREAQQAETFRKMLLAMTDDVRVILVKLADRLHNMRTLQHLPEAKRRAIAAETMEIYAPLANRLGMGNMKGELEDLAFRYLYPEEWKALTVAVDERMKDSAAAVETFRSLLVQKIEQAGVRVEVVGRVKRYWSIRQKLIRQAIPIDQLFDVLAFRVLVESVRDCYTALGIVHQAWRPVPGRIKDYIAMPKQNFYQSLHTTVVPEGAPPFEVQIRTREMDLLAENGIAAHWKYKEGKLDPRADEARIALLRQILETTREVQDPREFLSSLKIDLYPDEVYIFSPKGQVFAFPRGATPVDFAYRIHSDVGHRCVGARVNGRLVPLKTPLGNGEIVEILTSPAAQPSRDWLSFVVTSRARHKIKAFIHAAEKERAVEIGRRMLEKELKKHGRRLSKLIDGGALDPVLPELGVQRVDDLLAEVGFGKIAPRAVAQRLFPKEEGGAEAGSRRPSRAETLGKVVRRILPLGGGGIRVRGEDDLLATLAKCCRPVPGDEIVGYVTRGRGVSVHATVCPNVRNLLFDPGREIEVEWESPKNASFTVDLEIQAEDRTGMLARLTQVIADSGSNIQSIEARTARDGTATIDGSVTTPDRKHLDRLLLALRGLPGVIQVRRKYHTAQTGGA
ncbi:bifunctional (p)ppGpp synthetase/guanosine-3',5'-bis(diphosphate) 3'-pyrophosphohydrolase [Acidobacteria bacterium ACD]|nr:MAG: bifunctional (p)ppGpp synthetase/guanosine-3',5'-bis(diphosphate) 3'-pyrophosphohydrolase [Acidobacteriota bacterium]MCE7958782.1 bifunctional (p)ppGpp synthetase/guanosine-3',5'-bis(diphosphate) 3'-pyrophosphohydrolase [Acidobacteria bacterium ACB2]MDL1949530.1 bifunctional (p)ppGpp synthetase/guanosine-3',5'-bis(diphosphate) 3'-pyrophosphohydrolase [Acidobacteria bacterium ACD]